MTAYIPIIVPFFLGMGVFGLLRRRDKDPVVSGIAATFFSMAIVVAYFFFIFKTGNI